MIYLGHAYLHVMNKHLSHIILQQAHRQIAERHLHDASDDFFTKLLSIAVKHNGLPVTHETCGIEVINDIRKNGINSMDHGIYTFVGWHDKPVWVPNDVPNRYIIHALIPKKFVHPDIICPDDMYGTSGFAELLADFPEVVGAPIGINLENIPISWIEVIRHL